MLPHFFSVLTVLHRCLCGHQFCYVCGVVWKNCYCGDWENPRLRERAEQVAARPRQRRLNILAPARPLGRPNGIIQEAATLANDLNQTTATFRNIREEARQARARRFANHNIDPYQSAAERAADINAIAAHLRENHECDHSRRWTRFHTGRNVCEICRKVKKNPQVGECPTCFLQACYYCRKHRMRAGE